MTVILFPNDPNPRRLDLAPKHTPHVGSYYGWHLKRLLDADAEDHRIDSRIAWQILAMVVPAAVIAAALIVSYAR